MKRILALLLVFVLVLSPTMSAFALEEPSAKEEIVYGLLNLDGSVNNLYVVNIFSGGAITDYGNYSTIRNMTTSDSIIQNGELITVNTSADRLYYQGTLDTKDLPWDITITYLLDGKEISGADLAGQSGDLEILISVQQNNNINSVFFENYALQITASLDNKLSSNIRTENATIAEAGSKKQLAYTVLPGNGTDISIKANVRDFEMEPISINGIRLVLGITVDSDEFTGQITELADAIKKLDIGAYELLDGLNQLSIGMGKYIDGVKAFADGLGQLTNGAKELNAGATALKDGLSELSKQNSALVNGALAIQQATFDSVNASLQGMDLGLPILTLENYSVVLSSIPDLLTVKNQLDGAVQFTQGLMGYTDGVAQIAQGATELANGTSEFAASSSVIAASARDLYNAAVELNTGIKKIRDGLGSYKDGTRELRSGTSSMDEEINNKIDEMLSSISGTGDEVISFVSDKNTNVLAVQFVLKTQEIRIPEEKITQVQKPEELTFWQKLLKLFGLYKSE